MPFRFKLLKFETTELHVYSETVGPRVPRLLADPQYCTTTQLHIFTAKQSELKGYKRIHGTKKVRRGDINQLERVNNGCKLQFQSAGKLETIGKIYYTKFGLRRFQSLEMRNGSLAPSSPINIGLGKKPRCTPTFVSVPSRGAKR